MSTGKSTHAASIRTALRALGKEPTTSDNNKPGLVPTAATRAALDMLTHSNSETLKGVDLRKVAQDIYNWKEPDKNKVTRPIVRTFNEILHIPGKYHQAVELIAFTAALAPLLEPDRINNILQIAPTIETAFNPDRYTIQLHRNIHTIFNSYPEARIEKLATDLWKRSHHGRWWNLTVQNETGHLEDNLENINPNSEEFIDNLILNGYNWSPKMGEVFNQIKPNEKLRKHIYDYNTKLKEGHLVDPDVAVLASHLHWLEFEERPESPIASLLRTLVSYLNEIENFQLPKKPSSFAKMFPGLELIGSARFPYPHSVYATNGTKIVNGSVDVQLIVNVADLAANASYMGNCTNSYSDRMKKGTCVLYKLIDQEGNTYNASANLYEQRKRWVPGEINSRYNAGNVPAEIRQDFIRMIENLPEYEVDNIHLLASRGKGQKYTFRL